MNEQKPPKGIEWTRIREIDGTVRKGFTWNPTAGCFHGCTWQMPDGSITECYAKTVAERVATASYGEGFEHHYWRPEALEEPLKIKKPSGIFVGSMADLFGHWVPDEQIQQVLDVMKMADWHVFQTLSKYPIRLSQFNPFPNNVWVGVSLPAGHLMKVEGATRALEVYLKHMASVLASIRFMSLEPLWFDVAPVLQTWIETHGQLPMEWVIIGAASNGAKLYQPSPEWVRNALEIFDEQQIPVFFKGNLRWKPHREYFPVVLPETVIAE